MNALVLGGSVFVGRRLVEMLVERGHDVTVLNRGRTATDLPRSVGRLVADRTDAASMHAALSGTSWDAIYDVSGFVMAAGGSDVDGLLDLVDGTVGHYVYVSSIMAYDQSLVGVVPWTEDMPTDTSGPRSYGGFKALTESAMLARHRDHGMPVSIVRPAAIYGPHNNIYDMETPMFLRLLRHRPILVPHGGLVTASYGHVDDLCRAVIEMTGVAAVHGEILNITAEAVTTRRYVETLAEIVGVEPDLRIVLDTLLGQLPVPVYGHLFADRHHAVLSTDKARRLLGFEPEYDFATGHRQTYEWFRSQGWAELDHALADPVWHASWDFDAEMAAAEIVERESRAGPSGREREAQTRASPSALSDRVTDRAIFASVASVLRAIGDSELHGEHARTTLQQLVALAEHAASRGDDPAVARRDELVSALQSLAGNPLVVPHLPGDPYVAATAALIEAVDRTDEDACEVRAVIRPLLVRHLDEDLSTTAPLIDAIRGRRRDA